ncbi:hypothetical protein HZA97_04540 [Candidatus Woesearchaeota archaeon]|nr:hypothetical protein [Candidatus Woesearchaeota archaeon]
MTKKSPVWSVIKNWLIIGTAVVGFSYLSDHVNHKRNQGATETIYSQKNISVLEDIIKEEKHFLKDVPEMSAANYLSEDEAVRIFDQQIKKNLTDFLKINDFENPKICSKYGDSANIMMATITGLGLLGLFCFAFLHVLDLCALSKKGKQLFKEKNYATLLNTGMNTAAVLTLAVLLFDVPYGELNKSMYNTVSRKVIINYQNTDCLKINNPEKLAMTLTHEITHHLQELNGMSRTSNVIREGHSMGVARYLGKELYEKTGNPDFLVALDYELRSFVTVYLDLCKEFNVEPNTGLIEGIKTTELESHSLGISLFAIKEKQYGAEIYSEVLKGNNSSLLSNNN